MTLFAAALRLVGLSHREAAEFFGVRPDTVKSWSAGRNGVPDGAWDELRELYWRQLNTTEIGTLVDWPSEGAMMAVKAGMKLDWK